MKTPEEFINPLVFHDEIVIETLGEDIQFVSKNDAIQAVKDYHAQFAQSKQTAMVSDEQIEKWAKKSPSCKIDKVWTLEVDIRYREGLEDGAKAYRNGTISEWLKQNKE